MEKDKYIKKAVHAAIHFGVVGVMWLIIAIVVVLVNPTYLLILFVVPFLLAIISLACCVSWVEFLVRFKTTGKKPSASNMVVPFFFKE